MNDSTLSRFYTTKSSEEMPVQETYHIEHLLITDIKAEHVTVPELGRTLYVGNPALFGLSFIPERWFSPIDFSSGDFQSVRGINKIARAYLSKHFGEGFVRHKVQESNFSSTSDKNSTGLVDIIGTVLYLPSKILRSADLLE